MTVALLERDPELMDAVHGEVSDIKVANRLPLDKPQVYFTPEAVTKQGWAD